MTNQQLYLAIGIPILINLIGFFTTVLIQNKRIDDFKDSTNRRLEDIYKYLDAKFEVINIKLDTLDKRLIKLEEDKEHKIVKQ
jgi:low affinity Fe/Cu permease